MGGVGGDGVENEDCEFAVDDDEEENCESLEGEVDEEEEEEEKEEDDDERITNNHHIKNEHSDLSQANRKNEGAPHQQDQNMSEANYHSGDTSEEEDGGVSLYF